MDWINPLIEQYYQWIRNQTLILPDEKTGWVAISTPFIGAFNDTLEIYARKENGNILLSDNGETLNNLELLGVKLKKGEKRYFADRILANHGIKLNDDELMTEASEKNFPQKKHNLLSAMLEFNDLYLLSKNKTTEIFKEFKEDVRGFLDDRDIIYTPGFISRGFSGLEFTFDFQIARKDREIVMRSFNTLSKSNLAYFLFSWEDVKPIREKITKKKVNAVAIINDIEKDVKDEYLDALTSKNAAYVLWSNRNEPDYLARIAA